MSDPLLAVLLVTSSSRGSNIVFRWPNKPKLFKRFSRVRYYVEKDNNDLSRDRFQQAPLDPTRSNEPPKIDPISQRKGTGRINWDHQDENDDEDDEHDQQEDTDSNGGDSDSSSNSSFNDDSEREDQDDESDFTDDASQTLSRRSGRAGSKSGGATGLTGLTSTRSRTATIAGAGTQGGIQTGSSASRSKSITRKALNMEASNLSMRSHDQAASDGGGAPGASGVKDSMTPGERARRAEKTARAYRNYLGYEVDFLSSILSPRPELAHQKFELIVDDLAFLGHPVCVDKNGEWAPASVDEDEAEFRRGRERRGRYNPEQVDGDFDEDEEYDNDHMGESDITMGPGKASDTGITLRPDKDSERSSSGATGQESHSSSNKSASSLTFFQLVLVLDRPDPTPAINIDTIIQLFYDNVVFKLTAALFAEQVRANYVATESEKLLSLKERCMDDGQSYSAYSAQCLGISSLARSLKTLHKSISIHSDAFLTINDNIEVHLQLPPILHDPNKMLKVHDIETELDPNDFIFRDGGGFAGIGRENDLTDSFTGGSGIFADGLASGYDRLMRLGTHQLIHEEWTRTTGPYLLPWKTLLLLQDHPDLAALGDGRGAGTASSRDDRDLGDGFEAVARRFTSCFIPKVSDMLNLSEVADVLGWSLTQDVYPMVRHLIYYRQARVIDVPGTGHIYTISPLFDFQRLPSLCRSWSQAFPSLPPLPSFLSAISYGHKPFQTQIPGRSRRQLCLDVLIWLLRREVVVKVHMRLRMVATEEVKRRAAHKKLEYLEAKRRRREEKAAKREQKRLKRERRLMKKQERERESSKSGGDKGESKLNVTSDGEDEAVERGRSRDRSRSTDSRQKAPEIGGEELPSASGLSVSRPGTSSDQQKLHMRRPRHGQASGATVTPTSQLTSPNDQAGTGAGAGPISTKTGDQFEQLRFERRPVLRSRSPSTLVLSMNLNKGSRPRAGTAISSASSGGLTGGATASGLSRSDSSRRNKGIPLHVKEESSASGSGSGSGAERGGSTGESKAEDSGTSAPFSDTHRSLVSPVAMPIASGVKIRRKGRLMSRSPSRARLKVKGFGEDEEVQVDADEVVLNEDLENEKIRTDKEDSIADSQRAKLDQTLDNVGESVEEQRRLSLVGEESIDLSSIAGGEGDYSSSVSRLERNRTITARSFMGKSRVRPGSAFNGPASLGAGAASSSSLNPNQYSFESWSRAYTGSGTGMLMRRKSAASERPPLPSHSSIFSLSDNEKGSRRRISSFSGYSSSSTVSSSSSEGGRSDSDCDSDGSDEGEEDEDGFEYGNARLGAPRSDKGYWDNADSLIVEPFRASRDEAEWIEAMCEGKDPWLQKKFKVLLPYLNGKHTIDEIEHRERLKRKDLRSILSAFKPYIITVMHP